MDEPLRFKDFFEYLKVDKTEELLIILEYYGEKYAEVLNDDVLKVTGVLITRLGMDLDSELTYVMSMGIVAIVFFLIVFFVCNYTLFIIGLIIYLTLSKLYGGALLAIVLIKLIIRGLFSGSYTKTRYERSNAIFYFVMSLIIIFGVTFVFYRMDQLDERSLGFAGVAIFMAMFLYSVAEARHHGVMSNIGMYIKWVLVLLTLYIAVSFFKDMSVRDMWITVKTSLFSGINVRYEIQAARVRDEIDFVRNNADIYQYLPLEIRGLIDHYRDVIVEPEVVEAVPVIRSFFWEALESLQRFRMWGPFDPTLSYNTVEDVMNKLNVVLAIAVVMFLVAFRGMAGYYTNGGTDEADLTTSSRRTDVEIEKYSISKETLSFATSCVGTMAAPYVMEIVLMQLVGYGLAGGISLLTVGVCLSLYFFKNTVGKEWKAKGRNINRQNRHSTPEFLRSLESDSQPVRALMGVVPIMLVLMGFIQIYTGYGHWIVIRGIVGVISSVLLMTAPMVGYDALLTALACGCGTFVPVAFLALRVLDSRGMLRVRHREIVNPFYSEVDRMTMPFPAREIIGE